MGTLPVTVELTIEQTANAHDSTICEGSYTYDRHPAGWLLLHGARPFLAQLPLGLVEADTAHHQLTGRWQASQPVGPLLTGTWTNPAGQQLPFSLHEDYTDGQGHLAAVQYELLQEGAEVPCQPEREEGESKAAYRARTKGITSSSRQDFLHLLGPDTLRPALRALQCPMPATRRQLVRTDANNADCGSRKKWLQVEYNAYGLLAISTTYSEDLQGNQHPGHGASATLYDLRTGRAVTVAAIIRNEADTTLRRLITQHLEQEEDITVNEWLPASEDNPTLAPLPHEGLGMTEQGLVFQYSTFEIGAYSVGMPRVTISYAELLPLLRPDSPIARMLRERGLWKPGKSR